MTVEIKKTKPPFHSNLLISADPGARSGFVAAWLLDDLSGACYDVGKTMSNPDRWTKSHQDWNNEIAASFKGFKIRIVMSDCVEMLARHCYLFLTKNVYEQIPGFTKDVYSYDTVEKMLESLKEWQHHQNQISLQFYDKILKFEHTYDLETMMGVYHTLHGIFPTDSAIEAFNGTNKLNTIELDTAHGCYLAAMIFLQEKKSKLCEIDRFWSLRNIMESHDKNSWYNKIYEAIRPDNYGISDMHGVGVNRMTQHNLIGDNT